MSNFLDSDNSFLDNKLRFVRSELEENLNELLGDVKQEMDGNMPRPFNIIKPDPGMCIKAYRSSNGEKVFVNICTSDGIPPPEDISVDQLTTILSSETASNYKIPMSITELRLTPDRSGKDAVVCDVAIHPDFFRKVEALIPFRDFLITIIFEAMETKYNVQIDRDTWHLLKNRRSFGTLVKNRVQNRDIKRVYESYQNPTKEHKTLINELKSETAGNEQSKDVKKLITEIDSRKVAPANVNNSQKPEYQLYKHGDATSKALIAEFRLPAVMDVSDITLDLSIDRIVLEARRAGYLFDSFFPMNIDVNAAEADFNSISRILTVKSPILA